MPEKLLIIGPSWVGDMILAQSLFKQIKQDRPNAIIDVAAPGWTLPLLARMPEVNVGIALHFKHGQLALLERIRFGHKLRSQGYSQAILLTNSFKSAILPLAAGIPRRTGFLGEWRYGLLNDIRRLDKLALPRTVDRFVALGLEPGAAMPAIQNPLLVSNPQHAVAAFKRRIEAGLPSGLSSKPNMQSHGIADLDVAYAANNLILGLCPGAEYGEAKRWPLEYYAEVARAARSAGWQIWLFGSEKDSAVTAQINALSGMQCIDFGGKTSLSEAIDLMSLCTKVVSNDSGLMHLAAALDKPVIAIYGSSDPSHTPPMNSTAVIEFLGLACSPCFQRDCPLQHLNCLRKIAPATIIHHILHAD